MSGKENTLEFEDFDPISFNCKLILDLDDPKLDIEIIYKGKKFLINKEKLGDFLLTFQAGSFRKE